MKKSIYFLLLSIIFTFLGCEEFLQEDIKTFTDPATLLKKSTGLEQAVNGIYQSGSGLYNSRNFPMVYGCASDEMWHPSTGGDRFDLSTFRFSSLNSSTARAWRSYAEGINRANMVLDNIPPVGTLGISNEQQFIDYKKGEALFLRAWNSFKMMMSFGPVPLLTTYNEVDLYPSNSTIPELYTQIISDLKEAETLLPSWTDSYHEAGRATKGAAKSLLGIVYLAKGTSEAKEASDFQNSASKLKEVIDNEGYGLWENYYEAFLPENKNKKEDIFSFQVEANSGVRGGLYTEFNPNPPPTGASRGYGQLPMTSYWFNSFEANDKRITESLYGTPLVYKGAYINRATGDTVSTPDNGERIMHEKYLDPVNGPLSYNNHSANTPLIRYADVLLSYTEAVNEVSGPNAEAYMGINTVRQRAGLQPLSGLSKEQLFDAIVIERWHEFFSEGIRWFDLKRWGLLERAELKEVFLPFLPEIDVQLPKHSVFPIPQSELDANPNLKQNPGY